jgi:hypothetical protein
VVGLGPIHSGPAPKQGALYHPGLLDDPYDCHQSHLNCRYVIRDDNTRFAIVVATISWGPRAIEMPALSQPALSHKSSATSCLEFQPQVSAGGEAKRLGRSVKRPHKNALVSLQSDDRRVLSLSWRQRLGARQWPANEGFLGTEMSAEALPATGVNSVQKFRNR